GLSVDEPSESATAESAPQAVDDTATPELDEAALADALHGTLSPSIDGKSKAFSLPGLDTSSSTWSKTSNSDGSARYSVNKALAAPWDAKIGADISVV